MIVLSLGAGVQSTTMALMAAHGEFGTTPDAAIFADTGWEPKQVYDHLDWLETMMPFFPVHRVSGGNLRDDIMARSNTTGGRFAAVPWHMRLPDGKSGMGRRQCTKEYKLYPIRRKVRDMLNGKAPKGGCEMWIGISTDEAMRMKPSSVQYIKNRWPLIEKGMSRDDCFTWMKDHGYPVPPKSSCIGCPYHNAEQWQATRADPVAWADALEVDAAIRNQSGSKGTQYMHRSLKPLEEADLRSRAEKKADKEYMAADLFNNDCEGMCGV